jgi:hypothetical protein
MAKTITYNDDEDGAAPKVTWHGRDFITGKAIEVDEDRDAALIEAAGGNPFFEVKDGSPSAAASANSPYDKGYKAGSEGKEKSVPVAYRSKPEGDVWSAGWDDGARATGRLGPDLTLSNAAAPSSPNA